VDSHAPSSPTFPEILVALAISFFAASAMSGCSTMHRLGLWRAVGSSSFYGVSIGDNLLDVQMRYPAGETQTAPTGATAWVLRNITENGINYREVWFEFVDSRMELVLARFDGSKTGAVTNAFTKELGLPTYTAGSSKSDVPSRVLEWKLVTGEKVLISEITHQLVIIGQNGASLTERIELRQHNNGYGISDDGHKT
jgi:hypothetical protein